MTEQDPTWKRLVNAARSACPAPTTPPPGFTVRVAALWHAQRAGRETCCLLLWHRAALWGAAAALIGLASLFILPAEPAALLPSPELLPTFL
jgi:hypothetical protein